MNALTADKAEILDAEGWKAFMDAVFDPRSKPDFVVAIARKMPRLLEYLGYSGERTCPILSERALPWMVDGDLRGASAVFCDDILNVGSTLAHYVDYAQRSGLSRARAVVYARRQENINFQQQYNFAKRNLTVIRSFDNRSYWQFETKLPQLLLAMGKPYDLDFPIISLPITEADASRSVEEWQDALARVFCSVHDLTTASQRAAGVASFSLIEPIEFRIGDLVRSYAVGFPPILKVRLYISAQKRIAHLVPMCIAPVPTEALERKDCLTDGELNKLFLEFVERSREGDPLPFEPAYNLLVFLLSFEYGRMVLPHVEALFESVEALRPTVSEADLDLLFGPRVGSDLVSFLQDRLERSAPHRGISSKRRNPARPNGPMRSDLVALALSKLRERKYYGAPVTELIREIVRVLDEHVQGNDPRGESEHKYERLREGLSLSDLWWVATEMLPGDQQPSFEHMSFLLDYYVDLGLIVPVVGRVGDAYCRVYRRGEADPIEFARFIYELLQGHDRMFPGNPLELTMFTKIVAAQAIYHPDLVPLDPAFNFMGSVGYLRPPWVAERQTITAVDFLRHKSVISIEEPKPEEEEQPKLF